MGPVPALRAIDVVEVERRALEELVLLLGPFAGGPMKTSPRELPPHMHEAALGLYACDPGFVMTKAGCVADATVVHGPTIEISALPSAGEGAPGTCPSGGCRPTYVYAPPRVVERHVYFHPHGCEGGLLSRVCW
jgi:hypothetical protein